MRLVSQVWQEIPNYLDIGRFFPLSRLLYYVEYWTVVRASIATGVPVQVLIGGVKVLAIMALVFILRRTIGQYTGLAGSSNHGTRSLLIETSTLAAAASLVLSAPATHPLNIFPLLYLGTTAFALGVPLLLGRAYIAWRHTPDRTRVSAVAGLGYFLMGVAAGSMIELAYFVVPLGLAHIVMLGWVDTGTIREGFRSAVRSPAMPRWGAMAAGFAVVALPVRVAILTTCSASECYRASEVNFGVELFRVWPQRLLAGFPPTLQAQQTGTFREGLENHASVVIVGSAIALLCLWMAWQALGVARSEASCASTSTWTSPLAAYWMVVLFLSATLSAMSRLLQETYALGVWRETGFTWIAWSGLAGIGLTALYFALPSRRYAVVLPAAMLAIGVFVTSIQNQTDMLHVRSEPETRLYASIDTSVTNFDATITGNEHRCSILAELASLAPDEGGRELVNRLSGLLDRVTMHHYGESYCREATTGS